MKTAACLDVMPPFYKGLSQGEMGLLVLVCMSILAVPGLALTLWYGKSLFIISALVLGLLSAFMLPRSMMRKLSRLKSHHCRHYASKRFHRWRHPERYILDTRRYATKRTHEEAAA